MNGLFRLLVAVITVCTGMLTLNLASAAVKNKIPDLSAATPLDKVAYAGHLDEVQYFIRMGVLPNGVDKNGDTPLDFAVQSGHLAVARYLVSHLNPKYLGDACLGHAIISDYTATVRFLLTQNIHLPDYLEDQMPIGFTYLNNVQLPASGSPLKLAIATDDPSLIDYLISEGAKPHLSDLESSITSGKAAAAEALLSHGMDPTKALTSELCDLSMSNACQPVIEFLVLHGANVNVKLQGQITLLGWAVSAATNGLGDTAANATGLVKFLLDHGADPNAGSPSPFAMAVTSGHLALARAMLAHKANPNAVGSDGKPLLFGLITPDAYNPESNKAATLLLNHGANVNAVDPVTDQTVFQEALSRLEKDDDWSPQTKLGLSLLVKHGANVRGSDSDGTPLVIDAIRLDPAFGVLLIDHGANPNAVDKNGSPLLDELAKSCAATDTMKAILSHGGKPDEPDAGDSDKPSPIFYAISCDSPETVRVLARYGANVNQSLKGFTPLCFTVDYRTGDPDTGKKAHIVNILVAKGADVNQRCRFRYDYWIRNKRLKVLGRWVPYPIEHFRTEYGRPLDAAIKDNHPAIAAYLRAHGARR